MKKLIYLLLMLFISYAPEVCAQSSNQNSKASSSEYDVAPQYVGGESELMQFLIKNMKYPEEAHKNKIQGKVKVIFDVLKTGEIKNIRVEKSVDPLLDAEAIRVVSMIKEYVPAKKNGKAVDSSAMIPITFRLK